MTQQELQQKYFEYQLYEEHFKKLEDQFQKIDEQLMEIEYIKQSLEEIKSLKEDKEILCPISNGIFIKAKISKPDDFLVNVGENVICKKTPEETVDLLERQKQELKDSQEKISQQFDSVQHRMQELEEELNKLLKE